MRLLFDQNLSRHLVGHLRDVFPESEHVTALGLDAATDQEIWRYAREEGGVSHPAHALGTYADLVLGRRWHHPSLPPELTLQRPRTH